MNNQRDMKQFYVPPQVLQTLPVLLETALLGESIYRSLGPIQIDGQESAGEYDYATSDTFNNVWLD